MIMAQMKFGNCLNPQVRTTFLDYPKPFLGDPPQMKMPTLNCDTSKFGSGTARANIGTVDYTKIPNSSFNGNYDTIRTMAGSVQLPKESERAQYMPSVETLEFLSTQQESRLQPLPGRYFK